MPISNEAEIKKLIAKVYKTLDDQLTAYLEVSSYTECYQLVHDSNISSAISSSLSEDELVVFVTALSENEIEVNRLMKESFSIAKFFKRITDANTKSFVPNVVRALTNIKTLKRQRETAAKKAIENKALYRAARLTPRQKQVLSTLGLHINAFEGT
jgi:hypothetical protein